MKASHLLWVFGSKARASVGGGGERRELEWGRGAPLGESQPGRGVAAALKPV